MKFSSYVHGGVKSEDSKRQVESLCYEGLNRPQRDKRFGKSIEQAKRDELKAHDLSRELQTQIDNGLKDEMLTDWITKVVADLQYGQFRTRRMAISLNIVKGKQVEY